MMCLSLLTQRCASRTPVIFKARWFNSFPCFKRSHWLCMRYTTLAVPPDSKPSPLSKQHKTWIDKLPAPVRPYLYLIRIDKPIGTLLLFYPCAWSITMASYAQLSSPWVLASYLALFGTGAIIMRGAGCTINDFWDRRLDKAVERTKDRPLAANKITPAKTIAFLAGQLSVGLAVLLQLNWYSIFLGAASLPIVILYPLMKRVTYWPQFVLGLAFNWGAMLGWSAIAGAVNWSICIPLYASGVCWTLVYDSIYAHQDKTDDATIGIRSTALLFRENTRPILFGLSASSTSLLALAGYMNTASMPFYAGVGLAGLQLARVVSQTNFDDRASCWKGFTGCGWAGFWVWIGATADYLFLLSS